MFLNMTVAVGTINGLTFYSNIKSSSLVYILTSSKSTYKNRHLYLCWNGDVLENMASVGISHILDSSCYHHNLAC